MEDGFELPVDTEGWCSSCGDHDDLGSTCLKCQEFFCDECMEDSAECEICLRTHCRECAKYCSCCKALRCCNHRCDVRVILEQQCDELAKMTEDRFAIRLPRKWMWDDKVGLQVREMLLIKFSKLITGTKRRISSLTCESKLFDLQALFMQLHSNPNSAQLSSVALLGLTKGALMCLGQNLEHFKSLRKLSISKSSKTSPMEGIDGFWERLGEQTQLQSLKIQRISIELSPELFLKCLNQLTRLTKLAILDVPCCESLVAGLAESLLQGKLSELTCLRLECTVSNQALLAKLVLAALRCERLRSINVTRIAFDYPSYGVATSPETLRELGLLYVASGLGDLETVREAIGAKADVNAVDKQYGETALHAAARNGKMEVIKILVEEGGARLGVKNKWGQALMDVAKDKEVVDMLEEMVYLGADERPGEMTKSASKRFRPLELR